MRKLVAKLLGAEAALLIKRHKPRIVVVSGSVGKTTATQAIATVLGTQFSVRTTIGNYNTDVGVPASIFGKNLPSNIKNPFTWVGIMLGNLSQIFGKFDTQVLVLELGTDQPGDIAGFAYLKPEIAVVTAVAPEHMEFFDSIDDVAKEELTVAKYSRKVFCNARLVSKELIDEIIGTDKSVTVAMYDRSDVKSLQANLTVIGEHSLDAVAAAQAVARAFGMSDDAIAEAANLIKSQPGRMQVLEGTNGSRLIDDTYNASPDAVKAALVYLESQHAPQKIALLGQMNELGGLSESAHREIGRLCKPKNIDLVFTLGEEANRYLAEEAERQECKVIRTSSPVEAGQKIKEQLLPGALVLLKGSQNGVFAEEATKVLLANPADSGKLVRQTPIWMKKKRAQFKDVV